MSAVSPPAGTSAVSPANITGNLPMAEFWRAGLEYIARGVMAYQSAAQQTRLADAYSGRRSTTHAVAAAARQSTEQVGLHKEAFEDCVRALSGLAPGGLPVASSSDESVLLNTRITTLEAQVDRLAEKIEPVESRLVPLGDALARIESGRKAREDNLARVIAQVEKSHEQLEGRVMSLSNQVASNGVPESRVSATAHNSTVEPRITSPETKTKQRTGIKDLQEQLKGQFSRLESLETDLRDVMSQTEKIRGHVEPLLPLTPQVDTLLTTHARIESVNNELVDLREKSRSESAQVDLLKNSCESLSQNLEAIKLNTLDSFLTNVTSIFPSKEHIATLKTLSGTVDVLQQTVSSFTPLQTHVRSLEELAAKSTPLLSIASEHEELTQNMKQLQGDMTQHSHDISQVLSTTAALEQQVQGLGTLRTEVRGLIERFEAAKEAINGIRTLGEQVAKLNALDHPTTQNIAEIERRIAYLESREDDLQAHIAAAASLKDKVTALEATSTAIETVKSRMASFKPLKKHIPELLVLATQSESLASLIPMHKTTCEDLVRLRDDVKRDSEEGRLQLVELEKKVLGLGVAHPDVQTLAEELKLIKETTDTLHPLSQKFETLSSTTQDTLATLTKTTNRIPELEDEMGFIHDRIQDVLENLAALDPVKEQAEGLVLLAGRAELLVSLPEQFAAVSSDVGELRADWASLTRKTARVKKKLDQYEVNRAETTPPTARSRDQTEEDSNDSDELQRRLDTFEREMKSLKSKVSKASTKMGEFERTLNLEEARAKRTSEMLQLNKDDIVALLPLTNNVEVLVSLADQKAPLTSLVQDSQKVDSEQLDTLDNPVQSGEQPAPQPGDLGSQGSKSEKQLATLTAHYETLNAELGNVSKLQERVLELEIGAKALRVKLDEHDEAASKRETENKGLKGEADEAQALIDSMERKISNMSPLLAFVDELVALSSKADELLAFVDQAVPITERLSQLSKGQNSVSGCFDKLKDSVEALDKSVAALGLKNSGQEAIFKAIEQDSQEQKEDRDWCKRELRRLATEVNELAPLKRQGTAQLVSASPLESPGSPIQPESQPHEARISLLEKRAASAKKELVNIAGALLRLEAARNSLKTLLPLSDHVQGLIDLLARGGDASPADFMRRVSELEAKETNRAEHTNTIESLKSLLPLVDQTDTLVSFAGRFNTYEQLVDKVNGLLPLATHISELRASTQSITVHLPFIEGLVASNRANSSVQSQSSAPNQLWSPPSERYPTHPIGFSHELQAAPASLLPAPDITSNQGRPSKKRRLEAAVESLEIQLDSMRNEIDDVAWNVRALGEQRTGSKRLREPEDELVHTEVVQRSNKRPAEGRGHSKADLNAAVQEVFAGLWQGEDGWIEKLDMELGRLWAKTLRVGAAENAGLVIARTLGEVREDIDTLRLAVEARGSGVVVSGSAMATTSNAAGMEKIGEQLIENMLTEHSRFKDQLREWLDKTMKPITDMLAVVQEVQGKLE